MVGGASCHCVPRHAQAQPPNNGQRCADEHIKLRPLSAPNIAIRARFAIVCHVTKQAPTVEDNEQTMTNSQSHVAPSEVPTGIFQALNTPERSRNGVFPHVEPNIELVTHGFLADSKQHPSTHQCHHIEKIAPPNGSVSRETHPRLRKASAVRKVTPPPQISTQFETM